MRGGTVVSGEVGAARGVIERGVIEHRVMEHGVVEHGVVENGVIERGSATARTRVAAGSRQQARAALDTADAWGWNVRTARRVRDARSAARPAVGPYS